MKRTLQLSRALLALVALAAGTAGVSRAATPRKAEAKSIASVVPSAAPAFGTISPNKMTAEQAQATIVAERDGFYVRAAKDYSTSAAPETLPISSWNLLGHGDRTRKEVALTFDDGPHPGYTPELLSVLAKYHVPATFFLVGEMAEKAPDLVRDEIAAGDEVGNHTYHHVSLVKVTPAEAAAEIEACGLVLQSITGQPVHLFRPPGGKYDPAVAEEAAEQGYTTVLWTDDPGDYASPGTDLIAERTIRTAHDGGILLLHDGVQQTIDALPKIIETLRGDGYSFVTVDKMLSESRAAVKPGLTLVRAKLHSVKRRHLRVA